MNDLSLGHLLYFAIFAAVATLGFSGARLGRCILFIALWQLLTPDHPLWLDLLLMCGCFFAVEVLYAALRRRPALAAPTDGSPDSPDQPPS